MYIYVSQITVGTIIVGIALVFDYLYDWCRSRKYKTREENRFVWYTFTRQYIGTFVYRNNILHTIHIAKDRIPVTWTQFLTRNDRFPLKRVRTVQDRKTKIWSEWPIILFIHYFEMLSVKYKIQKYDRKCTEKSRIYLMLYR